MENDETVEKLIVAINGLRDVVPAFCIDRAAVEEVFELVYGVTNAALVSTDRRSQTLDGLLRALIIDYDLERLGVGAVVEGGKWSQSEFEEVPCLAGVSGEA